MIFVEVTDQDIDPCKLLQMVYHPSAGGNAMFTGTVRDHNENREVEALEYEIYQAMAEKSMQKICEEAKEEFDLMAITAVHREGYLPIGGIAICVTASAAHRAEAIKAVEKVVHRIKHHTPVWKQEHYVDGERAWVRCHHA